MENLLAIVKGKVKFSMQEGDYKKHINQYYDEELDQTRLLLADLLTLDAFTAGHDTMTLDLYFLDKSMVTVRNVTDFRVYPDKPKEGPDNAKL